jgi:hypothetical protein
MLEQLEDRFVLSPPINFVTATVNFGSDNFTEVKGSPVNLGAHITDPNVVDLQSGSTHSWTVMKGENIYASGPGTYDSLAVLGQVGVVPTVRSLSGWFSGKGEVGKLAG